MQKISRSAYGRRDGVSLMELLVVILVISVLLALLMPSWRAVDERVKQMRCMSNMKGLFQVVLAYRADNNDAIVPTLRLTGPGVGTGWYVYLYQGGYISNYNNNYCPSVPSTTPIYETIGFNDYAGPTYQLNGTLWYGLPHFSQISDPSRRMLFCDANWYHVDNDIYLPAYRHRDGLNLCFLDGHLEWQPAPLPVWPASPML